MNSNESTLNGRVTVVTGASSGIGRAIALCLANAGARVCIAARSLDKLKELQKEIETAGGTVTLCQCDVTNRDQVTDMIQHTEKLWGPVDILVNNAGLMFYTCMKNVAMDAWEKMIDVNCKGVMNVIGAALPEMIKAGRGHVVNMSSDAGTSGFPGLSVYSGTKFFIEGMSQALRHEVVEYGIKVTCIQPGDVKTNINNVVIDQEACDKYDQSTKMKILDPEDIARAVLFAVCQPEHSAVNSILIEPRLAPV